MKFENKEMAIMEIMENVIFEAMPDGNKKNNLLKAEVLTSKVVKLLENDSNMTMSDAIESVLIEDGARNLYKKYIEILCRAESKKLDLFDKYMNMGDWRIKENANMAYSLQGLNNFIISDLTENYWLESVYNARIKQAHKGGDFHIHDLGLFAPYCCGWSLEDLLKDGLQGVEGKTESGPPKHLRSALGQAVNFLYTLQGEAAGAQAFSNFDTLMAPFIREDKLTYAQVKQAIQEFVHNCNIPTRVGFQTPFINITMDLTVPENYKNRPVIIGGESQMDKVYGDYQYELTMFNEAFAEVMIEGDRMGRQFSFPIPTYNLTKDFNWDNPALDSVFEMTAKYGVPSFCNYINSDLSPEDATSMCPLTSNTEVLVKSNQNGVRVASIRDIVHNMNIKGTKYQVWTPGGWANAKPVKVEKTDVYEITLSNGVKVSMGKNHLQPIMGGNILKAEDLSEGMWLPFNKNAINSDFGSKELGFAVGAFLGDGSYDDKAINYSLCADEKDDETEMRLVAFWSKVMGFTISVRNDGKNVRFLRINGNPRDIIERYISGDGALSKSMRNPVFNNSIEFKEGVIEGLVATDGARDRKRIYTSSEVLKKDISHLFASLGKKYMINYEDNREGRLGSSPNFRIDYPERTNYGGLFKEDESFHYFKIVKIEKINYIGDFLYCFEVDNKDNLFMLASGLITHNCRLRLDRRELKKRGGGLFGSAPLTGSIGVVTINMSRLGYTSANETEFFEKLRNLMDLAKDSLNIKRRILEENTERGLYPYAKFYLRHTYSRHGAYWANHFNTIGINGMNECILNFFGADTDIASEKGIAFAEKVLDFMRDVLQEYQDEDEKVMFNLEATPAEGTGYKLALKDKVLYPSIITQGEDEPYYTNSSQLPVDFTDDMFEALDLQEGLQSKYTGGTTFHCYLGERIDKNACKNLVRKIAENYHIPYFTISPTYSVCKKHGYINGEHFECPTCASETEVWARVVGFNRPVKQWNKGKREEFKERVTFQS